MRQAASSLIALTDDFRITIRNEIHSIITHFIRNYAINQIALQSGMLEGHREMQTHTCPKTAGGGG